MPRSVDALVIVTLVVLLASMIVTPFWVTSSKVKTNYEKALKQAAGKRSFFWLIIAAEVAYFGIVLQFVINNFWYVNQLPLVAQFLGCPFLCGGSVGILWAGLFLDVLKRRG